MMCESSDAPIEIRDKVLYAPIDPVTIIEERVNLLGSLLFI